MRGTVRLGELHERLSLRVPGVAAVDAPRVVAALGAAPALLFRARASLRKRLSKSSEGGDMVRLPRDLVVGVQWGDPDQVDLTQAQPTTVPRTAICTSSEDTIVVRGLDLCQQAIGHLNFADYFFLRDNPKGLIFERWRHIHGCGRFFNAARDTISDKILLTYKAGEPMPDPATLVAPSASKGEKA